MVTPIRNSSLPKYFHTKMKRTKERLNTVADTFKTSYSQLSHILHLNLDVVCFRMSSEYKLVIVCSNEDQDKSHMVSKLQLYCRPYAGSLKSIHEFQDYLKTQFINWPELAHKRALGKKVVASIVDLEKLASSLSACLSVLLISCVCLSGQV